MDRIFNILSQNDNNILLEEKGDERKDKKVKNLKVIPLYEDDDDYCEGPHPILLDLPFSLLEIAPKGCGKTVLLQNLLKWYYTYFDNIFIWSPTINMDVKWRKLIEDLDIPEENLFTNYNENEIVMIMEKIKDFNSGKECNNDKIRVLFIFDDIIEQLPKGKKVSSLNKLAMNHRHYNISHIIISQKYNKVDTVIRNNSTGFILFNTDNMHERKTIIDELCGNIGHKKFENLYQECVSEKYSFMFVNSSKRKIYKNFEKEVGDLSIINKDI